MEECEITNEIKVEEGETICNLREYNLKIENVNYFIRLEINSKNLYIIATLKDIKEYNYKTKMTLPSIVNKLYLNPDIYTNLELILQFFDKGFAKNQLLIKINNNDESCKLIFSSLSALEENKYEIKLYKQYTKVDDKYNMLYINRFRQIDEKMNQLIDLLNINKEM